MEAKIVRHMVHIGDKFGHVWTESDAVCKIGSYVLIDKTKVDRIRNENGEENAILWNIHSIRVLKIVAASSNLGLKVFTYNEYIAYKVSLLLPILEAIRLKKENEEWSDSLLNTNFIPSFIKYFN